jgi:hypothetical protein
MTGADGSRPETPFHVSEETMTKKQSPIPAPDLPVLTSLEWHWLFDHAAKHLAAELADDIDNLDRIDRQLRIHGELVPSAMFPNLKRDPETRRADLNRYREIHAKLLKAAQLLSEHMSNAHVETEAEALADFLRGRRKKS